MRFERTALYAFENDFPVMASFLGISRWKDMEQVNDYGRRAAGRYDGLAYWGYNWKEGGGSVRMIEISEREEFYQQDIVVASILCVTPFGTGESRGVP